MKWGEKRYNSLDFQLKKTFGQKVYKVSLDGGFTCPNRDGSIDTKGCIFCSERGSGEFAGDRKKTIYEQIDEQISFLSKGDQVKYIAYFQNFTNTYEDIEYLREIYTEAISHPNIVGLAIATRADCLEDDVIDLLDEFNKQTYLWIEIGLQSIHEESAQLINRGYKLEIFQNRMNLLKPLGLRVVVHIILGIPRESKEDMLQSIKYLNSIGVWGLKIHLLHIIKGTDLEEYYNNNKFYIFEKDEYIEFVVELLEHLNETIVIHRLTGDATRETLLEPWWSLDKRGVLNGINSLLKWKDTRQGRRVKKGG